MEKAPEELELCAQKVLSNRMAAPNLLMAMLTVGHCFPYRVNQVSVRHDHEDFCGFFLPEKVASTYEDSRANNVRNHARSVVYRNEAFTFTMLKCNT